MLRIKNSSAKAGSRKMRGKLKVFMILNFMLGFYLFVSAFYLLCYAQAAEQGEIPEEQTAKVESLAESGNVTLDFKEADIRNVLKIISYKSGLNIVVTPEVIGNVTIRLVNVPWERALDVILKTYGFGYERQGNIILVTKMENIAKIQSEEPLKTEIFSLKFLDAQDAQRAIIPMLSPRGKISVLYTRGQKGWQFGTFKIGKQTTSGQLEQERVSAAHSETVSIEKNPEGRAISSKVELDPSVKSKTLIVTDTASSLDKIINFIVLIDKKPKQVLIETKIMEINTDKLKDIGFDWGTGSAGASTSGTPPSDLSVDSKNRKSIAGRNLASEFTPSLFGPKEGTTTFPGTYPYKAGLEVLFKKLTGSQFEVILHALEQNAYTNTLSSPRILTLDNQEASILVGFHTPILSSTVTASSTSTGPTQTQTLDYYQEIGIRLNVVPQVSEEGYINMIIHPSVTSSTSSVTATNIAGTGSSAITSTVNYPIIDVREAQTQVIMKDGETIVIGGLIKDVKSKEVVGIPFLSKIPLIGNLFKRETIDNGKIDLLIFITAHIMKEDEFDSEQIAKLEERMERREKNAVAVKIDNFPTKKSKP
ncbi:MAG: secretin and TonB N-terminal domain-containing protein [Candidatus Omnitrophota bacterium]|nr:secretin and TonB N-terminal domain-containing protein [Candidatus Omnitrophota bacterium]